MDFISQFLDIDIGSFTFVCGRFMFNGFEEKPTNDQIYQVNKKQSDESPYRHHDKGSEKM